MSQHQSSRTTQSLEYELIPTSDPIPQPNLDQIILNHSRAIYHNHLSYPSTPYEKYNESTQKPSTPIHTQRQFEPIIVANEFKQMRKIIQQQNERIQQLENLLTKERYQHNLQKLANQVYTNLFNDLIKTFQIEKIAAITSTKQRQSETNSQIYKKPSLIENKSKGTYIKSQLYKAKSKIEKLRQQLLVNSQNNVYTLFNSHLLSDNNIMTKHILQLNKEVQNLKFALQKVKQQQKQLGNSIELIRKKEIINNKNDRNNKFQQIQKGYQKLSQGYNGMKAILERVNQDQYAVKEYIEKLREDIASALQFQKEELQTIKHSNVNNQAIAELQKKFLALIEAFNTPQIINHQMSNSIDQNNYQNYNQQIRQLNQKIKQNEKQIVREKQQKQKLIDKIQEIQKNSLVSSTQTKGRLNKLESLLNQKKYRIKQLENTIIDHLEMKSKNNISSRQESCQNQDNYQNNKDNASNREKNNRQNQQSIARIFRKNKSQPFLQHYAGPKVQSMQIEIIESGIKKNKQSQSEEPKQQSVISKSSSQKSSSIIFRKVA